jgi:molybdate transport system substrate-binding protein
MNEKCLVVRFLSQLLAMLPVLALTAGNARGVEITVFAAASLSDALKEIGNQYPLPGGGKISFNFGASSTLARQIEEGAPADVFISADERQMDGLDGKGLILKSTRKDRLSNSLVIVTAADSTLAVRSPADLAGPAVKRIALADPKAVPAGVYAKAFLEQQKLWAAVQLKVVPTENVRAALAVVESGNVEAGIVFKTDAAISKRVRVACEIPREEGPQIRYPMALIKDSNQVEAAIKFLQYLDSDAAAKVFEKYGFIVLK